MTKDPVFPGSMFPSSKGLCSQGPKTQGPVFPRLRLGSLSVQALSWTEFISNKEEVTKSLFQFISNKFSQKVILKATLGHLWGYNRQ